jgi:hypothetical protein
MNVRRFITFVIWATVIGGAGGLLIEEALYRSPPLWAADFTGVWRAAGHLIRGCNPYTCIPAGLDYPLGRLAYPLPAAIVALPLAGFAPHVAAGIFVGVGMATLAFAVFVRAPHRLLMFASPPFVMAFSLVQWSPLLTAAGMIEPLGVLAVCKPNLGLALFARRPTIWIVAGGAVLAAVSFWLVPTWLNDWLGGVRGMNYYKSPVAVPGGFLLLLAALRWRDPDARFLLALSIIPTNLILYDQLPLFLIARTRREMLILFGGSWLAPLVSKAVTPAWIRDEAFGQTFMRVPVVALMFLPALYIVLSRSNESGPDLVDRLFNRAISFARSRRPAPKPA